MSSRRALAKFILASALAAGPSCAPTVTIDAPDIEVTQTDLAFPAVPAGAPQGQSVSGIFQIATAKLGAANNPDAGTLKNIKRLQLTRIVLKAKTGITDFAFLDELSVKAANWDPTKAANAGQRVIQIVDYKLPDGEVFGSVLPIPISPPVDMLPLWGRTWLYLTVVASGVLPSVDWSVDVVFSLSLRLTE